MGRRKKGKLGRLMDVKPHCYAGAVVGGCEGPLNEEHTISENLQRGKPMIVDVKRLAGGQNLHEYWPSQTPYTGGKRYEVNMRQASSLILCEKHNNQLRRADKESQTFQEALLEIQESRQSTIIRLPTTFTIDGYQFGRWLCKAYCGQPAQRNRRPYSDFVRYAFETPTQRPIYFFVPMWLASAGPVPRPPSDARLTQTGLAFRFGFHGLPFIVSALPMESPEMAKTVNAFPSGTRFFNRPAEISTGSDWARIVFDWSSEPQVSAL